MLVNGPQPRGRARQEISGRQQHQAESKLQTPHAGSDQAHVVVQRQPRHKDIGRGNMRGTLHRS